MNFCSTISWVRPRTPEPHQIWPRFSLLLFSFFGVNAIMPQGLLPWGIVGFPPDIMTNIILFIMGCLLPLTFLCNAKDPLHGTDPRDFPPLLKAINGFVFWGYYALYAALISFLTCDGHSYHGYLLILCDALILWSPRVKTRVVLRLSLFSGLTFAFASFRNLSKPNSAQLYALTALAISIVIVGFWSRRQQIIENQMVLKLRTGERAHS